MPKKSIVFCFLLQSKIIIRIWWRAKPGIRKQQLQLQLSHGRKHGVPRRVGGECCAVHVRARGGRSRRCRGGTVAVLSSILTYLSARPHVGLH